MNSLDRDQVLINKLKIDQLIKDVEELQDLLRFHVDGDATEHNLVNSKLTNLVYELSTLKHQIKDIENQLKDTRTEVGNLHNWKTTATSWIAGAVAVIYTIWMVFFK